MKLEIRTTLVFTILTLVSFFVEAQIKVEKDSIAVRFASTITAADLKEHLDILASDEYEGRETGKKGQKMAAEYISNHFSEFGLTAIDENKNYLQEFDLIELTFKSAKINDGELFKDFTFYGLENFKIDASDFVFAGYGIETSNYNNYENIDMKNKVVFFLEGEPVVDGKSAITGSQELSEWAQNEKKLALAKQKGAKKAIMISKSSAEDFAFIGTRMKHYYDHSTMVQASKKRECKFSVSKKFACKTMGIKESKFNKIIQKLDKSATVNAKVQKGKSKH